MARKYLTKDEVAQIVERGDPADLDVLAKEIEKYRWSLYRAGRGLSSARRKLREKGYNRKPWREPGYTSRRCFRS